MKPDRSTFTAPTGLERRTLGADTLLRLLAWPLPYNVRYTVAGDTILALATAPHGWRHAAWLAAETRAAASTTSTAIMRHPHASEDAEAPLETLRNVATASGWTTLDPEAPGLRLAVPGEHGLPPIAVSDGAHGLHVERPLPLLPQRDPAECVRMAILHAALVLNGALGAARLTVRDPRLLTFTVESRLLPGDVDQDEAADTLADVRRGAPRAAAVLDCLGNPAVARLYAIAHNLPTGSPS